MSQVVLITGCSTGIGRDLAQRLAGSGYQVVATARNADTLAGLPAALKLTLDVTQPESVASAVQSTLECFGRIDALVNNAGYAQVGALEELSDEQVQHMFAVNVFGALRMVREVVPTMRRQAGGRIINIGSLAGKFSTPVNGAYSATKFALEALSDALRIELAPFRIQVVLVEPGSIKTSFDETVQTHGQAILANPASPYRALYQKYEQVSAGMRRQQPGPQVVSAAIQQALEARRPKARYTANFPAAARLLLHLGDPAWDLVLRQLFKLSNPGA